MKRPPRAQATEGRIARGRLRVLMFDPLATVPYYVAYLSRALLAAGAAVQVGSITYYLDPECFRSRGLRPDPGALDRVGRYRLPRRLRQALKLVECVVNLLALALRFAVRAPDAVHVQFLPLFRTRLPLDFWFLRFCKVRGARLVLTVHDLLPHDTGERYKERYTRLYASMDALICHSETIRGRLEAEFGVPASKITVIPHGPFFYDLPAPRSPMATREALGVAPGGEIVLWQGILFPYKGVDLLLEAWRRVEQTSPSLCLVVLGTGDPGLTSGLEAMAQRLGLERVRFHLRFCSSEELVAAYQAAAMVVYPYRAITTSGALATGLALGKAIIASDLPAFRDLLVDGSNALLVDPQDPDALAGAIQRLAGDRALRDSLSAAVGAMHFGAESWTSIADETMDVYCKVLACN